MYIVEYTTVDHHSSEKEYANAANAFIHAQRVVEDGGVASVYDDQGNELDFWSDPLGFTNYI